MLKLDVRNERGEEVWLYEPRVGAPLREEIGYARALANTYEGEIRVCADGSIINVFQDSDVDQLYENHKAAQRLKRMAALADRQAQIDQHVKRLPDVVTGRDDLMQWVAQFCHLVSVRDVYRHNEYVVRVLTQNGYRRAACVQHPELNTSKTFSARYILGQLIDGLVRGVCPFQVLEIFIVRRYNNIKE